MKHPFKRIPDSDLWNKVQQLAQKDDGKMDAIDIIFQQQYKLPEENMELIKKLANDEQSKNIRLHIAKNLIKHEHIPFGMFVELFKILENDYDPEIKKSLENTSFYRTMKFFLQKIQPENLFDFSKQLLKKQVELQSSLTKFTQYKNSHLIKQFLALQKQLSLINIPKNKILIPEFTISDILTKELKQAIESRHNLDGVAKQLSEIDEKITELNEENTEHHDKSKKSDNIGLSIALFALCLSVGLAIGLSLLTLGATTHTQLDIFILFVNYDELNDVEINSYKIIRENATNHIIIGSIVIIISYVIGIYIMKRNLK